MKSHIKIHQRIQDNETTKPEVKEHIFVHNKKNNNTTAINKNTSLLTGNTSLLTHNTSLLTNNTSLITKNTSSITKNISSINKHTSALNKHTSSLNENTCAIEKTETYELEKLLEEDIELEENADPNNETALLIIDGKLQNVSIDPTGFDENLYYRNAGDDVSWDSEMEKQPLQG